jgi:hypothetical protein
VYFGSFDDNLYGLQRFDGELLTKNSFDNPVEDWPVVGKAESTPGFYRNTIFLGHDDGNVYSFDAICCG